MASKPIIFEYDNFRSYLKDQLDYLKGLDRDFTHRAFAQKAGFGSPSYFNMIASGQRSLGQKGITSFCRGLDLEGDEADYFEAMVHYTQSESVDGKSRSYRQMQRLRKLNGISLVAGDQYEFYSQWYHSAIRELVELKDFKLDFEEIAERLEPSISVREAKASWKLLLKLGLVKQDKNGRWRQTNPNIATEARVPKIAFAQYHESMGELAIQSIDKVGVLERDISAMTIGIKKSEFEALAKEVHRMREDLAKKFGSSRKSNDKVIQVNFQIFPLTK